MTSRDPTGVHSKGVEFLWSSPLPDPQTLPESYESNVNNTHDIDQGEMLKGRVASAAAHAH